MNVGEHRGIFYVVPVSTLASTITGRFKEVSHSKNEAKFSTIAIITFAMTAQDAPCPFHNTANNEYEYVQVRLDTYDTPASP